MNKLWTIIFFITLFISAYFFNSTDLLNADEGVVINNAWHIVNYYKLYIDIFELISPGSFYFLALIFSVFGVSYKIALISSLVILLIGAIGIFLIIKLINPKNSYLNYLAPIIFMFSVYGFPIINHNLYATVIIIWAIKFLLSFFDENKIYLLYLAGFLAGLSIIFLQHKGFIFLFFSILFLLYKKNSFKKILYYISASIIPGITLFLFWSPIILWDNLFLYPLLNYWEVNKTSFFLLIFFTLIYLFLLFFKKEKNIKLDYLLFIQIPLFISTISLPDYYHLIISIFPLYIVLIYYLIEKPKPLLISFLIILLYLIYLNFYYYLVIKNNFDDYRQSEWFKLIETECQSPYFHSGPFLPNLYSEINKFNVSKYNVLIENYSTNNQFKDTLNQIKTKKPDCALLFYYYNIKNKFKHSGDNIVEKYIRDNYSILYENENLKLYKLIE